MRQIWVKDELHPLTAVWLCISCLMLYNPLESYLDIFKYLNIPS